MPRGDKTSQRTRRGVDALMSKESVAPWLLSTAALGGLAAVAWTRPAANTLATRGLPTVAFAAIAFCTVIVAGRQRARRSEALALGAGRLPTDQLAGAVLPGDLLSPLDHGERTPAVAPYLTTMAAYTGVAAELLDHAIGVGARTGDDDATLISLRDDTKDLHELLTALCEEPPSLDEVARIHTLGALWESSFREHERRAAAVDPEFFERWRARTVAVRRVAQGAPRPRVADLPYRV